MRRTATEIKVAQAFLCGGTPRDKYLGRLDNIADLDFTNGEKSIDLLSQAFATKLSERYNITRKSMADRHSTIFVGNLKVDFSSNFIVNDVDKWLLRKGIDHPTNLIREMISRDFTCNALLMSLDLKHITDPTKQSFIDIKARKIKTCLPPQITLTSNRNRVIRAIYLACKLDFDVDEAIIDYVRKNPQTVKIATDKATSEKLNQAFERDADKASSLLSKMNLWSYVPITERMYPYYQKEKRVP